MAAESTQGDTHDKAWERAEKKFAQYVSIFLPSSILVCPFSKHDLACLKPSVIAGSSYTDYGVLRATHSNTG